MWRSRHARPPCRGWRSQRGSRDTRRSRALAACWSVGDRPVRGGCETGRVRLPRWLRQPRQDSRAW